MAVVGRRPGIDGPIALDRFTCPASNKPYVYRPDGPPTPANDGQVIVFDATPAHLGYRWAISVIQPSTRVHIGGLPTHSGD